MNWAEPHWLNLLLLPGAGALLLIAMRITRRREGTVKWPGIKRVVAAGSRVLSVPAGRSIRRPWLLVVACALAVVALGRPRWGEIEKPVFQQAREVMLALDLSRSMLVQDVPPDRLSRARLLLRGLLDGLRGERVGLIVFAGTAFVQVPLSADYQILNEFLPELNPNYMPQGGTDYSGMLSAATGGFSDTANTDRFLIILSDGEALDESWKQQLPDLEKRGVRVIALGVGTAAGGFIPDEKDGFLKDERGAVVLSRLETNTLRALARETGGVYRDASTWVDLATLLHETVERGRRGDFTEEKSVEHIERFQWFLAPAVLLAVLGIWREIGIRPRPRSVASDRGAAHRSVRRSPAGVTARTPAGVAMAVLGALLVEAFCHPTIGSAAEAESPPDPAEEVRETVTRLAKARTSSAADWQELAERTLAYGQALKQSEAPVEKGPVWDALAAVEEGRRIDNSTTDWGTLRAALEKLLEEPPQQEEQEKQEDDEQQKQENQDQKQQQDGKHSQSNDQSGESEDQKEQNQQNQNGEGSEQEQNQQQQEQQQDSQNQSGQPENEQRDKQDSNQQKQETSPPKTPNQPAPAEGRLGDLENQDPTEEPAGEPEQQPKPPPPPKQPTRKIGGRPADERGVPPSDPELAAALQRLRQATDDDSPARLFELLEGENADKPKSGKDW